MMQVSVESLNTVERKIRVVVPSSQVDSTYQKEIYKIAATAKIPGFRPGKAPLQKVEQQFGASVRQDAMSKLIRETLFEALQQEQLQPVNTPKVEPEFSGTGQDFAYSASFEILPEITEVKFNMSEVEKPKVEITDENIDLVLVQLKRQFATWNEVSRPAQLSDRLVIDFYPVFDGQADLSRKMQNFPIELGSKSMMDGFEDALLGVNVNDTKVISLVFPDDFPIEDKAGKPVEFHVTVKGISEIHIPALDKDIVKKLGVESGEVDDLRAQIRDTLNQEKDRLVRERVQEQAYAHVLEQNEIEVPKSLIQEEAKRIHDEAHGDHHHHHSEEEMQPFLDAAKKRLALSLLLAAYAKKHDIQLTEDEINLRISELARLYQKPQEVMEHFSKGEARHGIESRLLEEKIIDDLLKTVTIRDVSMTFADLKQAK